MPDPKHLIKFREIARMIAKQEGKKVEVNIAQINEILRITLEILAQDMFLWPYDTMKFLEKYTNASGHDE